MPNNGYLPEAPNDHYEVLNLKPRKEFTKDDLKQYPELLGIEYCADPDMSGDRLYYFNDQWLDFSEVTAELSK
jgi:hypothetical protein